MMQQQEKEDLNNWLKSAVMAGDLAMVEQAIIDGGDPHAKFSMDRTLLYYAASQGHDDIVRRLLKEKLDPNACDEDGMTPLHAAIAERRFRSADALIAGGANINFKYEDKVAPVHMAFFLDLKGGTDRLSYLLGEGVDTSVGIGQGGTGKTVFDLAREHAAKHPEAGVLLKMLVDHASGVTTAPEIEPPAPLPVRPEIGLQLQQVSVAARRKFALKP